MSRSDVDMRRRRLAAHRARARARVVMTPTPRPPVGAGRVRLVAKSSRRISTAKQPPIEISERDGRVTVRRRPAPALIAAFLRALTRGRLTPKAKLEIHRRLADAGYKVETGS